MGHYYFDVRDGEQIVPDTVGSEFGSPDDAVQRAARAAAEIGTTRLVKGDFSDVIVEVRNEDGQRVCTITASMKIERHIPPL
jgi:hypothetical protein